MEEGPWRNLCARFARHFDNDWAALAERTHQRGLELSRIGDAMGDPLECEHPDSANGDTLQQTTTGLAIYRQNTNTPEFTDGFNHWVLGNDGLQAWAVLNAADPVFGLRNLVRPVRRLLPPGQDRNRRHQESGQRRSQP